MFVLSVGKKTEITIEDVNFFIIRATDTYSFYGIRYVYFIFFYRYCDTRSHFSCKKKGTHSENAAFYNHFNLVNCGIPGIYGLSGFNSFLLRLTS